MGWFRVSPVLSHLLDSVYMASMTTLMIVNIASLKSQINNPANDDALDSKYLYDI